MSMTVQFYKYTGNPKKINKTFAATYTSKTIDPTDFYDDEEPQLILAHDATLYDNANYCVIGTDCYFIRDRGLDTGNRMIFFLEKDLLTTKLRNKSLQVIINRNTVRNNAYLADDRIKQKVNYLTYSSGFPLGGSSYFSFNWSGSPHVIAAIIGGGGQPTNLVPEGS